MKITIVPDASKATPEEYDNVQSAAKALVEKLTEEERLDLFAEYCSHCGCDDPTCQCWNDE